MADTNTSDMQVIQGSLKINGNLTVDSQITTKDFKLVDDEFKSLLTTSGNAFSFRKSCEFLKPVQFNNGQTIIGIESTYKSAYIGSPTIQAGNRLIVGDSDLKITNDDRTILADTFKMLLDKLVVTSITNKKQTSDLIESKKLKITDELISQNIYADTIKTNNLAIENIRGINLEANDSITTTDLLVNGSGIFNNDVTIKGTGVGPNGFALTVNGGKIKANWGIESNTADNIFQTLTISGSGKNNHDTCFKVEKGYDSHFGGNVTIEDSNLILDNSKLVSDNIIVTPFNQIDEDEQTVGVMMTSNGNWDEYLGEMIVKQDVCNCYKSTYDPYNSVENAIERNKANYQNASLNVKTLLDPINYLMEKGNPNVPGKFQVKSGIYRIDSSGRALLKNVVAEKGTFSSLDAYKFNVNQLGVDKIITTSVASNVVDTDQLLKSRGIAEFDGAVNSCADIFIESGSKVNVANGASITINDGATLKMSDGAKFEMGSNSSVKLSGDIEIELSKLVFVDENGNKFKIGFRECCECGENSVVMEYSKVDSSKSTKEIIENTKLSANELNDKLKSLGL